MPSVPESGKAQTAHSTAQTARAYVPHKEGTDGTKHRVKAQTAHSTEAHTAHAARKAG